MKHMTESGLQTGKVRIAHCENPAGAEKLKQQLMADLPVKSVELISCRGLTSFYAMEKGLIVSC